MRRPCLGCGDLIETGSRCRACTIDRYQGDYQRRAKAVREGATVCWLCGEGARPDDPWQADHLTSSPDSPLMAAHRSCNARRGKPE
jgi:hypothetical protein